MPDIIQDWNVVQTGVGEMQAFLLSPDLYRPLGAVGHSNLPQLSVGVMLLAFQRLQASPVYHTRGDFITIDSQFQQICDHWKQNLELKIGKEYPARLRQWGLSFSEMETGPDAKPGLYSYEIRLRVMLDLFIQRYPAVTHGPDPALAGLDQRLRAWLASSKRRQVIVDEKPGFVWEADLANGFPRERFWYLYLD
jgi:hypothetical protein